jgi:hypothetical protein
MDANAPTEPSGPNIRARSKFAMTLAGERAEHGHRVQTVGEKAQANHIEKVEEGGTNIGV